MTEREPELDPTGAALLGLLALRDWTTYELAQQAKRSLRWFWNRAERKIYDEPKKLVSAGWATSRTEHTGRRAATVYAITPAGRDALRTWLDTRGRGPVFEIENLLRVFFADQGHPDQLRTTIAHMGDTARTARQELLDIARDADLDDPIIENRQAINVLSNRLVLALHTAIADWSDEAAEITRNWTDQIPSRSSADRNNSSSHTGRTEDPNPRV